MIVTQKSLSRRTVLRGLGATVALPLLDAMVPALSAAARQVTAPVPRLAFFYVPNGILPRSFHPEGAGGSGFDLTPVLQPLAQYRDRMTIVTGLSNSGVVSPNEGGGVHTRAHGGWLNGILPKRTEGADIRAGKTIDQYAADQLGTDTALRSLELTTESNYQVGNCENGYSCAYRNSTSWLTPTTPLPHERDPRVVFQRLFGDGGSVEARLAQMRTDRSILDSVGDSIHRLEKKVGAQDRATVGEYLQSIREIERRIQRTEANQASTPLPAVDQPAGVPDDYEEHVGLLHDMLVLAFQADVTRVSCMQMARETSGRTYPNIGVPEAHHTVSHHQQDPHNITQYTKISQYQMQLFARLVEKMADAPDGDGTLLDHAILLHGAGMGDGDQHTPYNLPITLMGGGCGQLAGNRHLVYDLHTPFMNLGLTLLEKVGVEGGPHQRQHRAADGGVGVGAAGAGGHAAVWGRASSDWGAHDSGPASASSGYFACTRGFTARLRTGLSRTRSPRASSPLRMLRGAADCLDRMPSSPRDIGGRHGGVAHLAVSVGQTPDRRRRCAPPSRRGPSRRRSRQDRVVESRRLAVELDVLDSLRATDQRVVAARLEQRVDQRLVLNVRAVD